jgi:hypothetical protein
VTEINENLREHVTNVGFSLTLGKTHIAALVRIDLQLKENLSTLEHLDKFDASPRWPHIFNYFVQGQSGLIERGLIQHIIDIRRRPGESVSAMRPRRIWRITPAGRLVINLLKEAGIYQEYAAMWPAPIAKTDKRIGAA